VRLFRVLGFGEDALRADCCLPLDFAGFLTGFLTAPLTADTRSSQCVPNSRQIGWSAQDPPRALQARRPCQMI
jgi:hypothetical protein